MRACLIPFAAVLALPVALGALNSSAVGEEDPKITSYGRHLAQECAACHGIGGTRNGIPPIVGWNPDQFISTLEFYRTGERTNPVMVSVVKSLDENQVRALAAYYASLPKPGTR